MNSVAPAPARRLWGHLWYPSARGLRVLAVASLVSQIGIIVTGGAVRLTGSGLGCPTFPRCTADSFTNTPELGLHGYIEFGNRLLTWVLVIVALATFVAALRYRPYRRSLRRLALALLLGIPAQAILGGIVVLADLNPWLVMGHFLLSALLVAVATTFLRRIGEGDQAPTVPSPWLRRLAGGVLASTALVLYAGTVVTGSGPHAGDDESPRTGLDVGQVSQLHADLVFLLLGLTVGLYAAARALQARDPDGWPEGGHRVVRAALVLLVVELAQGVVGFVQYFTDLPVVLVGLHMLGAALLTAAAVDAWLSTRSRGAAPAEAEHAVIGGQAPADTDQLVR